jgi:hypothetical protein
LNNIEWNFHKTEAIQIVLNQTQGVYKYWRYRIILERDGGTMLVGLIIPGVLVAFLGSLYYLLPMGSGERISYLATILLTEIMFLVMIT